MPRVLFTSNLQRYVAVPESEVGGTSVAEALTAVFAAQPQVRDYVLDEQGHVRKHIHIYVDGHRRTLADPVNADSEICVLQALSGG